MPGSLSHRRQQFREGLLPCRIFVGIHVLAQQLDFGVAKIGHLPGFGQNGVRTPAAFLAAGKRDHAVGAELVAAFDDGDVAAMRIGAGSEFGLEAFVGFAVVKPGRALPCFDLNQHLRQIAVRRRAAYQRNIRRALENLLAFLLRHAAQHAELLALLLQLLVVVQAVEDFLLGLVADGAGVVENQSGFFDGLNLPVALGNQRPHDLFRVMGIHLAAKGFEVKRLLGLRRHTN